MSHMHALPKTARRRFHMTLAQVTLVDEVHECWEQKWLSKRSIECFGPSKY